MFLELVSLVRSQLGPWALLTVLEVCRWCAGVQSSDEMTHEGSRDTTQKGSCWARKVFLRAVLLEMHPLVLFLFTMTRTF